MVGALQGGELPVSNLVGLGCRSDCRLILQSVGENMSGIGGRCWRELYSLCFDCCVGAKGMLHQEGLGEGRAGDQLLQPSKKPVRIG